MSSRKTRVGVIFGSRSVEHEVSIVTALQVYHSLDRRKYEPVPIYITKEGNWLSGEALGKIESYRDLRLIAEADRAFIGPEPGREMVARSGGLLRRPPRIELDVAFPCVHGTFGEDGTLQGLFELADIPYVGAGVVGSAVGMDKILMKAAFASVGLPTVAYHWFTRSAYERDRVRHLDEIEARLRYPLFVKPANLGSSVGITRAKNRAELEEALAVAASYDRRLLIEEGVEGVTEINCSVLGNDDPIPSVCEMPVAWQEFLSYEDKYLRGGKGQGMKGATRRIPAPISPELTRRIQDYAVSAFKAVDCAGIARIDFLVGQAEGGQSLEEASSAPIYVNEINTIPGSMAFYLWEATGIDFTSLTDRLIQLAFERHGDRQRNTTSFDTTLLQKVTAGAKTGQKTAR